MKQFRTILSFEFKSYLRNKVFVGVTLFLVILIGAVMFFPRISEVLNDGSGDDDNGVESGYDESGDGDVMLISAPSHEMAETVRDAFGAAFAGYAVKVTDGGVDEIKDMVSGGEAECAFVMNDLTSYTYYVGNLSMYDQNTSMADEVLKNIYRVYGMIDGGLSPEAAAQIMGTQVTHEIESLGKNQTENFFYTYIMVFALYMVILLYGQMVATNVAAEKSARTMEVLITSARPTSMMFGKVIASCLAGLIQLVCVFGSAVLFFNINKQYWGEGGVIGSIFNMPIDLLLYMLLFFILGFFIYAFMYGAVGSTASKLEDINTSVMPITMLFVISFIVVVFSMSSGDVDNMLMKVCSYIPFTSPMAMFTRIAMSTVHWYEIALSAVILTFSVFAVGVFAAKIYRVGVILYGSKPKIGSVLRSVFKA